MKMNKGSRSSTFIDLQYMFFFEVSIGVIANMVLLLFHVLKFHLEHRARPTDLTIAHLALIHSVMLLTVGFIAIDIFGFHDLRDDIMCKCVIYLYRVLRGLSICITCLLSVLQAITLSPRNSCLANFKLKSLNQSLCCFLFLWSLNMLTNCHFLKSTIATPNVTSRSLMFVTQSCSILPTNSSLKYIYSSLLGFQSMSFIGLMALSSGYKVFLLCRHESQSHYLRSTSFSQKVSAEKKATKTVLLLMSFFTVMYILDCATAFASEILWNFDQIRHSVQLLVGNAYATVSPMVLMITERRMIPFFRSMWM